MQLKMKLSILLLFISQLVGSAPINRPDKQETSKTTTSTPQPSISDACISTRTTIQFATNYSRKHAAIICERAAQILKKSGSPISPRTCGQFESEANELARQLTSNVNIGDSSSSSQGSPPKKSKDDDEYCPDVELIPGSKRKIKLSSLKNIIDLVNRGASEKTIKAKYNWYRRQYIDKIKECYSRGGSHSSKTQNINESVLERVKAARSAGKPIHDYMIRHWALRRADEINFDFSASNHWLENFKNRNGIRSKKVTARKSSAQRRNEPSLSDSVMVFQDRFEQLSPLFPKRLIVNVDQSGVNYEISNERTLSFRGERDTILNIDSANRATHSYTIQPTISRDGRIIGKLLICLQEPDGQFGQRVKKKVEELEKEFGNIKVIASRSGKMSTELMTEWFNQQLLPDLRRQLDLRSLYEPAYARISSPTYDPYDDPLNEEEDYECHRTFMSKTVPTACPNSRVNISTDEPIPGPSWIEAPDTVEVRDQIRTDRCLAQQLEGADQECYTPPFVLLLVDSWGGHSSDRMKVEFEYYRSLLGQLEWCNRSM